jgi:hypothetical protein
MGLVFVSHLVTSDEGTLQVKASSLGKLSLTRPHCVHGVNCKYIVHIKLLI